MTLPLGFSCSLDLAVNGDSRNIRVRVSRLWESMNTRKNELISLDIILVDENGTVVWAQVRRNMVSRYRGLLVAGEVYTIGNFSVIPMTGDYRPVDSTVKLVFTLFTTVTLTKDPFPTIPRHGFQFVTQQTVMGRVNDNTVLTDVVGCLTAIGDLETVSGGFRKRDLELMSDFSVAIKVTLWAEMADSFITKYKITQDSSSMIIVFTSMRVKRYLDVLNFSATSATHIYTNPEHEYVTSLADVFMKVCPGLAVMRSSIVPPKTFEEEMFENRMSIEQLLQAEWACEKRGYKITILGVIDDVDIRNGWFYFGCKACLKKVSPNNGEYNCAACNTKLSDPLILYKIHLDVRDDTGVASCVILHKLAERVIDSSAMKLFNKGASGSVIFPQEVLDLVGRRFIFKLSLTTFNLQRGSDVFTVCDVYDPVAKLEEQYQLALHDKGTSCGGTNASLHGSTSCGSGRVTGDLSKGKSIITDGAPSSPDDSNDGTYTIADGVVADGGNVDFGGRRASSKKRKVTTDDDSTIQDAVRTD